LIAYLYQKFYSTLNEYASFHSLSLAQTLNECGMHFSFSFSFFELCDTMNFYAKMSTVFCDLVDNVKFILLLFFLWFFLYVQKL